MSYTTTPLTDALLPLCGRRRNEFGIASTQDPVDPLAIPKLIELCLKLERACAPHGGLEGLKRYTPLPEDDECTMNYLDGSGYLDCSVGTAFYLASEVDAMLAAKQEGVTATALNELWAVVRNALEGGHASPRAELLALYGHYRSFPVTPKEEQL